MSGAKDPTIYRTYRGNVGGSTPQAERHLTFRIPVRRHEAVDLRLHFAELYWGAPGGGPAGPGKRIFDVEAGGRIVLSDFDITRAAGQALTSVVVPISNVKIENNVLTLTLKAKTDFAAISAIEVFSHR
ncbi:MAG: malectin domain-containing carbohydrate-binding protein [Pyrinomonadaceae bacterium]